MAILKCKMCGGDLNITEGVTVCECEYCGTKQTVPTVDDEKKLNLFARANRLRFGNEFDKAAGVYEAIVADFPEEAEAYWGLVLCKYGIEYVDDPATAKKIPTCHRSSFDSVMDDSNFELVLEYADPVARGVYREEAKQIEELRRGIIAVSSKEEPYDIFICYKETDEKGERTIDSVIAQDVYTTLTEKGYRVFFSRISLEDKLGVEYEPYIFAALNSAKIMLAVGTDYEYYNAVWVKNEWSRFLQLIEKGEKKTLIPCYKNIDAYDIPKEFAKLQAQDMGKVGAMQDLLRGIEKIMSVSHTQKDSDLDAIQQQLTEMVEADRKRERAKRRRTGILAIGAVLLGLLGYFVLYPWFACLNGNYSVYINMYKVENFTVPQRATYIGDQAFANCTSLKSVTITDNVTDIGNSAFLSCHNLTEVTIGSGVTSIGDEAFAKCDSLTAVTIPDSVSSIGNDVFLDCYNLSEVNIGSGVGKFGTDIFNGCDKLETVTINSNVNSNLLAGTSVVSVTIGDGVTSVEAGAFSGCDRLKTLTIGSGVTAFGSNLFENCSSLNKVVINSNVAKDMFRDTSVNEVIVGDNVTVGDGAFAESNLQKIVIGSGVVFGEAPFDWCGELKSVTIDSNIPQSLFDGVDDLADLSIGSNVEWIGMHAFFDCWNLIEITIPSTVGFIGHRAFGFTEAPAGPPTRNFYYDGSMEQWKSYSVSVHYNYWDESVIHCSDGDIYNPELTEKAY